MSEQSLSDRAVMTLSAVQNMTDKVSNDHPERQCIRGMKRTAEQILSAAFLSAMDLAYQAKDIASTMRELEAEKDKP